jgi:hypothetical protein
MKTMTMQLTTTQMASNADNDADVDADKDDAMQTMENDADNVQ